jgi:hypothetical protein
MRGIHDPGYRGTYPGPDLSASDGRREAETNITTVVEPGGPNLSPLGSVSQTEPVGPEVAMARRADAENSRKGEKMPTPSGPDVTGAPGKGAGSTGNGECVDATYVLPDTLAR